MQPEVTITWVGHATVLFEIGGFRVITDPILTSRVVHLRRRVEVPAIDPVDVVLIPRVREDRFPLPELRAELVQLVQRACEQGGRPRRAPRP